MWDKRLSLIPFIKTIHIGIAGPEPYSASLKHTSPPPYMFFDKWLSFRLCPTRSIKAIKIYTHAEKYKSQGYKCTEHVLDLYGISLEISWTSNAPAKG